MLMQTLLLSTRPPSQQKKQPRRPLTNLLRLKHGLLYPRWFMLSAMLDLLFGGLLLGFAHSVPCSSNPQLLLSFYCIVDDRTFTIQILLIGLAFVLGWLGFFFFGYQSLAHAPKSGRIGNFLRISRILPILTGSSVFLSHQFC